MHTKSATIYSPKNLSELPVTQVVVAAAADVQNSGLIGHADLKDAKEGRE